MRCVSFCTAQSYKITELAAFLRAKNYKVQQIRKILYVNKAGNEGDIFFFPHGCFITWGLKSHEEKTLKKLIIPFSIKPLSNIEVDYFIFRYGEKPNIEVYERFNKDIITLESDNVEIKLAISYGLTQSTKLGSFEESVQKTINKNADLAPALAKKGRIWLRRKTMSKRLGEIFIARNYINLNSEFLDIPEYFWERASGESYYLMCEKFLDIPKRVTSLNQKLDVLQKLFDMLTNQLQHVHQSILEWIIILIIFGELILSLARLI